MKDICKQLLTLFDNQDRKHFCMFVGLLFINGLFSLLGIGAVVPLIHLLLNTQQINSISWLKPYTYQQILCFSSLSLILAFWIKNAASLIMLSIQARFLSNISSKVQQRLFRGYLAMPYVLHLTRSTPDMIRNINNETVVFSGYFVYPMGVFLTESISSILVFGALLWLNPIFAITIGISLFLILFFFSKFTRQRARHHSTIRAEAWSSMTKFLIQGLESIKETKLYHKEHAFLEPFEKGASQAAKASAFSTIYQQSSRFIIETAAITIIACGLFIFVGLLKYDSQQILVFLSIAGVASIQLLPGLNRLMQAIANMKYGRTALKLIAEEDKRIRPFLDSQVRSSLVTKLRFNDNICLDSISFAYDDSRPIIKNLSLVISKHKKIALVGGSGAGKTTLVDVLMGLHKPQSGKIILDGHTLQNDEEYYNYQKLFGYIPQIIYLFNGTIADNIAFGVNDGNQDRIWECLKSACLDDFVLSLPQGINTNIGENGLCLSGGQRQRIGIARALYHNPEILVMDEATSSLDSRTEHEVTQAIISVSKNHTVITIAHRLSTIKHYDHIYVLKNGCIVSSGDFEELTLRCDEFKKISQISPLLSSVV